MNNISLIGRLTKDYEVKNLPSGKSMGILSLAVDDGWGDNKHTSFFEVVVFGKQVDAHSNYIGKGSKIGVQGSIRQDRWEGQDGTKRSKIKVIADRIEYLDAKPTTKVEQHGFDDMAGDDIPF